MVDSTYWCTYGNARSSPYPARPISSASWTPTMSITHIESVSQLNKILSGSKEKLSVRWRWRFSAHAHINDSLGRSLTSMQHGWCLPDSWRALYSSAIGVARAI